MSVSTCALTFERTLLLTTGGLANMIKAKRKADDDQPLDHSSPKRLKQSTSPSEEPEQKPALRIIPFPEKVSYLHIFPSATTNLRKS